MGAECCPVEAAVHKSNNCLERRRYARLVGLDRPTAFALSPYVPFSWTAIVRPVEPGGEVMRALLNLAIECALERRCDD